MKRVLYCISVSEFSHYGLQSGLPTVSDWTIPPHTFKIIPHKELALKFRESVHSIDLHKPVAVAAYFEGPLLFPAPAYLIQQT
jgi:hypothetical protein